MRINNLITTVPEQAIFDDYARWAPTHIVRKPPDAQFPNLPGPIDYVLETPVNAGQKRTSGIDMDLHWRLPANAFGRIELSLSGTYLLTYRASDFEDVAPGTADEATGNSALSRWRRYAALDWSRGPWGATLAHTLQSGYSECDPKTLDDFGHRNGRRHVEAYAIFDLLLRYQGVRNLKLQLGVRNLFDRPPPTALASSRFQVGYDPDVWRSARPHGPRIAALDLPLIAA